MLYALLLLLPTPSADPLCRSCCTSILLTTTTMMMVVMIAYLCGVDFSAAQQKKCLPSMFVALIVYRMHSLLFSNRIQLVVARLCSLNLHLCIINI